MSANAKFLIVIGVACVLIALVLLLLNYTAVGTIVFAVFGALLMVVGLVLRLRTGKAGPS